METASEDEDHSGGKRESVPGDAARRAGDGSEFLYHAAQRSPPTRDIQRQKCADFRANRKEAGLRVPFCSFV